MASVSAHPELMQPITLLSHPTPDAAELVRHAALPATAFSATKNSTVCVGAAYKLSSDVGSLRRLKATLPILVAGNALNLVNPLTQTPLQSFTLSSAETASSAPVTLLRSIGGGRSLRVTYVGIDSHTRSKSRGFAVTATHQLCAYVEQLSAKGKESAEVNVNKQLLPVAQSIRLIHALADGRLVLTHPDDSLTIVSNLPLAFDDQASVESASTALNIVDTIPSTYQPADSHRAHFHVDVLNPSSAKRLISGCSRIEEAALIGLRVAVTSSIAVANTITAVNDDSSKKKKRSKRSKKDGANADVAEDHDPAADVSSPASVVPSGSLALELTAFVKSFDGASDSAISTVKLGSIKLPNSYVARHVQDVHLHPEGRLVVLSINGHLTSMSLSTSIDGEPLLTHANTSILPALALPSSARPSSSSSASPLCCLLLSRDHALVVGVTSASSATADKERVAALIVDLELNAVLRQIDWPVPFVPSSGADSPSITSQSTSTVSATRIAGSTAIITVGPPTRFLGTSNSSSKSEILTQLHRRRVCVLSMPFVAPQTSVLHDVLGKGQLTTQWMRSFDAESTTSGASGSSTGANHTQLLEQIKKIAQADGSADNKNKEVNAALLRFVEAATLDGRMLETLSGSESDATFYSELLDVLLPANSQRNSKDAAAAFFPRAALLTLLKHPRVHPSIFTTVRPSASSNAGLAEFWTRLGAQRDPQVVGVALQRLPDISETTVVSCLTLALRDLVQSRQTRRRDAKPAASLMALLSQVVQVRVSRPALRSALKAQLRDDVDQIKAIFQICNVWLSQTIQLPLQVQSDNGLVAVAGRVKAPDAQAVMAFAIDALDTFLPLILATPDLSDTVRTLASTVSRYEQLLSTLQVLNAPLSAFAKLQQENDQVAALASTRKKDGGSVLAAGGAMASAGNQKVSTSSRADAAARAEMGGGLGIRLGTQGEAKTRRVQLFEQSMLVGAYSFERLDI